MPVLLRKKRALVLLPMLVVIAMACSPGASSDDEGGAAAPGELTVPASWDRAITRPASESDAASSRAQCRFRSGAMPAETLGAELPVDRDIPIQTIVVLMQENRSFDSYFGHLNRYANRTDIESPPETASNPERVADPTSGPQHPWTHGTLPCLADTNHEWSGSHLEYNGGKMDGFFQANQGFHEGPPLSPSYMTGDRALWWYDEREIKFYYDLASTFAIGDHYHASLLGPTYPNRDYLYAATSLGVTDNAKPDLSRFPYPDKDVVIFDELQRRGISWAIYVAGFPQVARVGAFLGSSYLTRWRGDHIRVKASFFNDARDGTLPQVVFIDAPIQEAVYGEDEHPPADVQHGQKFVSEITQALFTSPQWKSLALFITYDEGGGIYDHVAPPQACPPDDVAPVLEGENRQWPGNFDRLGFRVPFIAVSPFTKRAYVSHKTYDHTSITRFIETKFKLPALTNRDANAEPLFDFFDFENPPFLTPPTIAPATIDDEARVKCVEIYGDSRGGG